MTAAAPDAADDLFDLPVGEFVATRDELVARLRAAGDRELAAVVKSLRRPTLAAWAVNRVVRDEPEAWATLAEAGRAARQAQRRALSGIRDARLRTATAARRAAIDVAVELAVRALVEVDAAPAGHVEAIAATFEAASADPDVADAVGTGRLCAPVDGVTGFASLAAMAALSVPPSVGAHDPGDADAAQEDAAARARRTAVRALDEARQRARSSARAAAAARARADNLAAAAATADRRAATLRDRADQAVAAADRAAAAATEAATALADATTRADLADERAGVDDAAVTAARTALDDLA